MLPISTLLLLPTSAPHSFSSTNKSRNRKGKMKQQKSLPSPHQVPSTMHDDERHDKIATILQHSVLAKLASNTNSPVSKQTSQLQQIMQKLSFHTPTHPTYASMIFRAIDELNEEQGSSFLAISAFIETQYNDLPCGHHSFLSHHLSKLCRNGGVKCTTGGRYMLEDRFEGEKDEEFLKSTVCEKDQWKLKQVPHEDSKPDTLMIERQLRQTSEDSADEKQRQLEQKIDFRSRTIELCSDDAEGLKVTPLAMVSPLPVTVAEKLQMLNLQNDTIRNNRQQDQKMDVIKPQIVSSFQDDEENVLNLNIPSMALASSPQMQQENLEQSQLRQPHCGGDGPAVLALNQLQQTHNCQRNESNLRQNDSSACSELHVDAKKEKSSMISPKQETQLNSNAFVSCTSNAKQHLEQQPPKRGQGRPRKLISDVETTPVASSQSYYCKFYNHEERQFQQCSRRGRPFKLTYDAEGITSEKAALVSSESYHYKFYQQEEGHLSESGERKLISDEGKPIVVPSQSYHYKFYQLDETQLPRLEGRVVRSHSYHYKFYNPEETQSTQLRETS